MFFSALSHFLFLFLRPAPGAPAFHYRSQHFSAYTSDRASRSRGQPAADITPRCKTTTSAPNPAQTVATGCPRRPAITKECTPELLCQVAGHVTHSGALPSSLTLVQSQCSSCALPFHSGKSFVRFSSVVSQHASSLQSGARARLLLSYSYFTVSDSTKRAASVNPTLSTTRGGRF